MRLAIGFACIRRPAAENVNFALPIETSVFSLACFGREIGRHLCSVCKIAGAELFSNSNRIFLRRSGGLPVGVDNALAYVDHQRPLKPGETLLILGIGGGVASASLQVAKKIGARVIVTSGSNEKLERARDLGADYGISHGSKDFVQEVQTLTAGRGVDVVLDSIGGEFWRKSSAALAAAAVWSPAAQLPAVSPSMTLRRFLPRSSKFMARPWAAARNLVRSLIF